MLTLGKVSYTNTLPIFYELQDYKIVEGHPSELAKLLREGKIHGGIISSVEIFFNPNLYRALRGVSISSRGSVCSVLILSDRPIEEIESISLTPRSLTSKYLALYVMKEIYRKEVRIVQENAQAKLLIGDEALKEAPFYPFVYDLGQEWFKATSLPFVFALFLVRREVSQEVALRLKGEIQDSIRRFFEDLRKGSLSLGDNDRKYLLECIDYSLGEEHITSLKEFFRFMEKETGHKAPDISALFLP